MGRLERQCDSSIAKKGDLSDCSNWRGIALLSIPGKIMASIMLNRMKEAMDNILRQEQAGFSKGGSYCEHILTLGLPQIIEKVHARDRSLYISFVDF